MIDEYLNKLEPAQKTELQRIRRIIEKLVPNATEVISYGMPGFQYKSKYLITFGAFKNHLSLFPGSHAIEVLSDALQPYTISKGTIQFSTQNPISDDIIKAIVQVRLNDIEGNNQD